VQEGSDAEFLAAPLDDDMMCLETLSHPNTNTTHVDTQTEFMQVSLLLPVIIGD
jgi:hypothetical protein